MHKALLSVGAIALFGTVLTASASAQMCGSGQQAQASPSGAMMCGAPMGVAASDPKAEQQMQKPQMSGMCPCCRNMAMMRGGKPGGMPGMEMPKQ